jgi:hypothetical protein
MDQSGTGLAKLLDFMKKIITLLDTFLNTLIIYCFSRSSLLHGICYKSEFRSVGLCYVKL